MRNSSNPAVRTRVLMVATLSVPLVAFAVAGSGYAAEAGRVDFDTQVIPVLTKAGCNSGACHGAAIGRGGFKLSLYGGDPAGDFRAIVHELEGRRVNLAKPELSLLLRKSIEELNHGGGARLDLDGRGYRRLLAWIREGASRQTDRKLTAFQLVPRTKTFDKPGAKIRLAARARFSDGSSEDVTPWTVFTSEDPASVQIDSAEATALIRRRGEHILIARFLDRVAPIRLSVPLADPVVDHSARTRAGYIDELIFAKLKTLRLPVSEQLGDAAFLRRVTLDLTGRLPTPAERSAFLADQRAGKRKRLIDRQLRSEAFTDYWTFQFAKLLRIRSQPRDTKGARAFHDWLRRQIHSATPYDRMARSLLTATGDSHVVGPANFFRVASGPRAQAELVSELFLGTRLRCANCHNHPLDRWTQDDYHGFAAVFARIQQGRVIRLGTRGEVTHPRTGAPAKPRIPGARYLTDSGDGRVAFAEWLTARENPYFAKAIVNRLWKALIGRGLVEPADDFRATNPATHPRLLDKLAADFIEHDYDIRHMIRRIVGSRAYSRSSRPAAAVKGGAGNAGDNRYYSRGLVRRLEAEVLADAISDVTGVPEVYGKQPAGTRAVTLFDPQIPSTTLDLLGRCSRTESCESPGGAASGLSQKLHLMNGKLINRKIGHPRGRLARLVAKGKSAREIVDDFFIRALSRPATPREWKVFETQFAKAKTPAARNEILEDIVWSLLSSREFTMRR